MHDIDVYVCIASKTDYMLKDLHVLLHWVCQRAKMLIKSINIHLPHSNSKTDDDNEIITYIEFDNH